MSDSDQNSTAEEIAALVDGGDDLSLSPMADSANSDSFDPEPSRAKRKRRIAQRDVLIGITESCDLWHDSSRSAYVTFLVGAHRQHWPVRSREFRLWLSGAYYRSTGTAIGGTALDDGLRILEARAINDGPRYQPFVRVGRAVGRLFLDLADEQGRAVEISAEGWSVVSNPPIRFLRTPAMRSLPEPEVGGMIEELRRFINVRSDSDFVLVVAWLVAAMRDCGPYPILAANGEQGSGKSIFCRILRMLVDPSAAPIRAVPRDERDILVSAGNSWILAFDNLSTVPPWLSDALCRLATGGGFATRALHTDRDEIIFEATRPILLNGIPMLTDRADLADRALTIHLRTIGEQERRTEAEIFADFETAKPRILAALLDATAGALRNLDTVQLPRLPRLADFAKWAAAAESGLGWTTGSFLPAYEANRRDVSEASFEADLIAMAICNFVTASAFPEGWRGSATELLSVLTACAADSVRKARRWPAGPSAMGNAVVRAAPLLRGKGFTIERRHSGSREITIMPPLIARMADQEIPA